jgi:hypothetical protein
MARRSVGKANPSTAGVRARDRHGKTETAGSESSLKDRLRALERERDALRTAFEREQVRVRKLEEANASARDRVAWALDSLQNILDGRRQQRNWWTLIDFWRGRPKIRWLAGLRGASRAIRPGGL